ncbi:hypothetical protein IW140_001419 [Coemansia sp. RSA 1813]|nr:hypothetical protein EV178_001065 [Coemansia sp. RSA 1646]KAJ1772194.1 hypothetical protein LPJ74_001624 [Coemansia sp. RSA 1843]KAJ2091826.1 hypothetical protein IW138_001515 [Coemansia sp. RSA 986]KAJ2215847.1 hypothetical protein EV179_001867 [Coemansia sp. RSA 487]KAJ2571778.1 hypothetical protein IW140_001419 [Coemansia sp. RSA 1813]
MATMQAVVFKRPYEVAYEQVPRPTDPRDGEAIVRVKASGLCGSDLHPYRGAEKGLQPGTVCGHEFSGIVEQVGTGVKLEPGARVAASFTTACGSCWFCKHSLSSRCEEAKLFGWINEETGDGIHGAQAQFVRVPNADSTLVVLPPEVSFEDGVLLGDIFPTGYFCASNALNTLGDSGIPKNELTAAVIGCGPVGLCAISGARALGFGRVYAIDRVESRLQKAQDVGAIPIYPNQDALSVIHEATMSTNGGYGADAVLEVVGAYGALETSFQLVRPGGVVSSVGVHAHDKGFPVSPEQCYDKNITFRSGRCPARSLMPELCHMVGESGISQIISHKVPLSRASEMYKMFESQADGILKVIFDPWG